jgi:hypothetical protein
MLGVIERERERYVLTTGAAELIGLISSCAKLELVIQDLKILFKY